MPGVRRPQRALTSTAVTAVTGSPRPRSKRCASVAAGLAPTAQRRPRSNGRESDRARHRQPGSRSPAADRPRARSAPIVSFGGRDPSEAPADAGHLAIQELVLRLGRAVGYTGSFELPTRPAEPWRSADVGLASERPPAADPRRVLEHHRASPPHDRQRPKAGGARGSRDRSLGQRQLDWPRLGRARHGEKSRLVARYPEVFASRFPGSSRGWVDALTTGSAPPSEPGLVWCDVGATRLFAWRRR